MKQLPKLNYMKLSTQLQIDLIKLLEEGYFNDTNKLPPEEELAKALGVSRTALRDVLSNLEQEGYIIRRRKHGTFINQKVVNLRTRLDIEQEFLELIREAGFKEATLGSVTIEAITIDEKIAEKLEGEIGEPAYKICKVILADDVPAIYCEDYFLKKHIIRDGFKEDILKLPIFDFFNTYCDLEVYFNISQVKAIMPKPHIMKHFNYAEAKPILTIEEVAYDANQKPILFAYENYNQDCLDFYLYKKKY